MIRRFLSIAAILTAWHFCALFATAQEGALITEPEAARHGLTRPWWNQVQMDPGMSHLQDLVLYKGVIYAQTDRAMVHAIDAETGATLWSKQIGSARYPSMTPGFGFNWLAVLNGSHLYVVNRFNGELLFDKNLDGTPIAGAAVSKTRIYVPTSNQQMLAYGVEQQISNQPEITTVSDQSSTDQTLDGGQKIRVNQKVKPPITCQSFGQLTTQPIVARQNESEEYIAWPTDRGNLYIARIENRPNANFEIKYRLQTAAPIIAQPTYFAPDPNIVGDSGIYLAASGDGFVTAIYEKSGETAWQFSTGEPLDEPPVVVNGRVYAPTTLGGMYCIDAKKGDRIWFAPNVMHFIAASKNRVYCEDRLGQTLVLSASTGAKLDVLSTILLPIKMINSDTDRIYLATESGLIQCLHEAGVEKPIIHDEERKVAAEKAKTAGRSKTQSAKSKPAETQSNESKTSETK